MVNKLPRLQVLHFRYIGGRQFSTGRLQFGQFNWMRFLLVTPTIAAVCECLLAERARIRTQSRVQDQMVFQRFRSFVLVATILTFESLLIGMHDHVHFQCTFCVQLEATVRTHVHRVLVNIFVCLKTSYFEIIRPI